MAEVRIHSRAEKNRHRIAIVLGLTTIYMLAEAVGGYLTNSLALISDAGHMLTDAAALALALFAMWFSSRPATPQKTYGYYRLEILAALANGVALIIMSLLIFFEAYKRAQDPPPVLGFQMMLIASGGLFVNALGAWILRDSAHQNMNIRGAFLHVLGDALGSVGAILAGFLMWWRGWYMADPIISVVIGLLIIYSSWRLISDSTHVLLEGTPAHLNTAAIIETILDTEGVSDVHDLHVWTITTGKEALSAHVVLDIGMPHHMALQRLRHNLRTKFDISHVTIQIETPDCEECEIHF